MNDLIENYVAGANLLRRAVAGMSAEQLKARPVPGKWSTLEVICHIADFEPVYVERMKRVIALDEPTILGADENLFAKSLAYHERDGAEEIELIDLTRRNMARILRALPAAAWHRQGIHNERGPVTLEKLVTTITGHIPHHLRFVEEKRKALGLA